MGLLGLTKAELEQAVAKLFGLLCDGKTEVEAAAELGLDAEQFTKLKDTLIEQESGKLRGRSREEVYLDYLVGQKSCLADLGRLSEYFKTTNQLSACVGAVRARSEVLKEILRAGQDLGVITRAPTRKEIVGGVFITELDHDDLKKAIARELSGLNELVEAYGDKNILEVEPGRLHLPEPAPVESFELGEPIRLKKSKIVALEDLEFEG